MVLQYSIRHEDSLIRVSVVGSWDYLSVERLWREIATECKRHQCLDILGESDTKQWTEGAAYDFPTIFNAAGISPRHRIAWVQKNAASRETTRLVGAVLRNRKLAKARVFDSLAEAKRWLTAGTVESG